MKKEITENNLFNLVIDWIISYEKYNIENNINDDLVSKLWYLVNNDYNITFIKDKYKIILNKLKKFDTNYFSRICILLNSMKINKKYIRSNIRVTLEDFYYIEKDIEVKLLIENNKQIELKLKTYKEEVNYNNINYKEGILNSSSIDNILKEGMSLLIQKKIDLNIAKFWVEKYRKHIIMNYGRWSAEYEKFMEIPFGLDIFFMNPSLCLDARRVNIKNAIKNILQNYKM